MLAIVLTAFAGKPCYDPYRVSGSLRHDLKWDL
jgi:hypothetical protein